MLLTNPPVCVWKGNLRKASKEKIAQIVILTLAATAYNAISCSSCQLCRYQLCRYQLCRYQLDPLSVVHAPLFWLYTYCTPLGCSVKCNNFPRISKYVEGVTSTFLEYEEGCTARIQKFWDSVQCPLRIRRVLHSMHSKRLGRCTQCIGR